jgi:hypothetical protein
MRAANTARKHERILDQSIRLFRERGFSAVYSSMIGALILARAVNDEDLSREILTETRKRIRLGT